MADVRPVSAVAIAGATVSLSASNADCIAFLDAVVNVWSVDGASVVSQSTSTPATRSGTATSPTAYSRSKSPPRRAGPVTSIEAATSNPERAWMLSTSEAPSPPATSQPQR